MTDKKNSLESPWRVVRLLAYVFILLSIFLLLNYYLTSQQKITEDGIWYISADSSISIRMPYFGNAKKEKKADISQIRKQFGNHTKSEVGHRPVLSDSLLHTNKMKRQDSLPAESKADSIALQIRIQYPEKNQQALVGFFEALQELESGQSEHLYRVLHYGDSQLENDRITSNIRVRFQERFGGCGAGIQGMNNQTNAKFSVLQENDPHWKTYSIFGLNPKPHNYFGVLGTFQQFIDTAGYVVYKKSERTHLKHQKVENIKILYRNPQSIVELKVTEKDKSPILRELNTHKNFAVEQIALNHSFEELKIDFHSQKSPDIYGIALDCQKGIAFDNIPIRGSSGLEFHKIELNHLREQYQKLQVRLVILQFGVNVGLDATDYTFYENLFYKEIMYLKQAAPKASFLIIGTSDRSYKKENGYASYAGIPKLRDAQRRAAFRAGCAFWDLYEAMGGKNSMPTWVDEGLASKDYTHFKPEGATLVGNMLFEALIREYELFKNNSL